MHQGYVHKQKYPDYVLYQNSLRILAAQESMPVGVERDKKHISGKERMGSLGQPI